MIVLINVTFKNQFLMFPKFIMNFPVNANEFHELQNQCHLADFDIKLAKV